MIKDIINTLSMQVLEKAMDAASLRHSVIANNIANAETPGFKRSDVAFADELKKALGNAFLFKEENTEEKAGLKHIPIEVRSLSGIKPKIILQNDTTLRNDGNNVDIDKEMALMAENTIMFELLAQQISGEFSKLKTVITEGGRG